MHCSSRRPGIQNHYERSSIPNGSIPRLVSTPLMLTVGFAPRRHKLRCVIQVIGLTYMPGWLRFGDAIEDFVVRAWANYPEMCLQLKDRAHKCILCQATATTR